MPTQVEDMALADRVRPYTRVTASSAASHWTAASLWDMPAAPAESTFIHISRPRGNSEPRRREVIGHKTKLLPSEVVTVDGLTLTTRARTWLDLAEFCSIDELVVLADHLIRIPRPRYEGRVEPYATQSGLLQLVAAHKGKRGVRKARTALALSRVGADSPPETRLRLALDRAGLPEPDLNAPLLDHTGQPLHCPDLSYPNFRISIEYEGIHHRTARQFASDIRRDEAVARAGWVQVRISQADMASDARIAVNKIRRALRAQGWQDRF